MRQGQVIAAGAAAAVTAGLLVTPAMGDEAPESDPAALTETATGAEQPTADYAGGGPGRCVRARK